MNRLMKAIRRWSRRSKLRAVSDDYLEQWLDSLGVLNQTRNGDWRCCICGEPVDVPSIQMVGRVGGQLVPVCDKLDCMYRFTQIVEERTE